MPVRQATRRYTDVVSFLREYPQTLGAGALVLSADVLGGEPAPELKVDLVLPLVGRVGPLVGQVVAHLPDGGAALRLTSIPSDVQAGVERLRGLVEEVKGWLLETGQVELPRPAGPPPEEVERLVRKIAELEGQLRGRPAPGVGAAPQAQAGPVPAESRSRGLAVPDFTGIAPALEGPLEDRSFRDALMALAVEKQTGIFVLRRPDGRTRWGFWSKGGPVGWRTEPMDEQEVLGMLLFRAGTITKEQLAESLAVMDRTGCRQGEALIEMGICTFPQVVVLLQKQTDFVLQRVLREREGTWAFYLLESLPERFITPPLRVASILYRALLAHTKDMPAQELAANLRPWLDNYVFVVPGVERTFDEMKLNTDEVQFIQIIQKTSYRLREIFAVSSLSRSQTAAAVWSLYDLNLIEFRTETTNTRDVARWEREIAGRKAQSQRGTLFEQLDLHWICTTADVEAAYRKLAETWRLDLVNRYGEQHRPTLEFIRQTIDGAYKTLVNDASRREYRAKVIEKSKIDMSAEMLIRKGEMAIMKAAQREATDCYTKALELLPGNGEAREGLNRARAIQG